VGRASRERGAFWMSLVSRRLGIASTRCGRYRLGQLLATPQTKASTATVGGCGQLSSSQRVLSEMRHGGQARVKAGWLCGVARELVMVN
jgi:hypothetical protein